MAQQIISIGSPDGLIGRSQKENNGRIAKHIAGKNPDIEKIKYTEIGVYVYGKAPRGIYASIRKEDKESEKILRWIEENNWTVDRNLNDCFVEIVLPLRCLFGGILWFPSKQPWKTFAINNLSAAEVFYSEENSIVLK